MKIITISRHNEQTSHNDEPELIKTAVDYMAKCGKHFTEKTLEYALNKIENADKTKHVFTISDIKEYIDKNDKYPSRSNIFDITYTANMAYADFHPTVIYTVEDCIRYALAVANDIDGYEGIEFCRWVSDLMGKSIDIKWGNFI